MATTCNISKYNGASGDSWVNRHKAKSISSIAVPEVTPRMSRSKPGDFGSAEGEGDPELLDELSESSFALCSALRYLCPTLVRTLPFGAGLNPFIMGISIVVQNVVGIQQARRISNPQVSCQVLGGVLYFYAHSFWYPKRRIRSSVIGTRHCLYGVAKYPLWMRECRKMYG